MLTNENTLKNDSKRDFDFSTIYAFSLFFISMLISIILITLTLISTFGSYESLTAWLSGKQDPNSSPVNIGLIFLAFTPVLILSFFLMLISVQNLRKAYLNQFIVIYQRGYSLSTFYRPVLLKTIVIAIFALIIGYSFSFSILQRRYEYKEIVFVNEFILGQFYSIDVPTNKVSFFLPVLIIGFFLYSFCLFYLLYSLNRFKSFDVFIESFQINKSNNYKIFLISLFFTGSSALLLFELINNKFRSNSNWYIVSLTICTIIILIVSLEKMLFTFIEIFMSHRSQILIPQNSSYEEKVKIFLKNTGATSFRFLSLLLVLGFILNYYLLKNLLEQTQVMYFLIGILTCYFIILYFHPNISIIRRFRHIVYSTHKNKPRYLLALLTLFITIFIWQSSSYLTITNTAMDEAYFNTGGDIRVALDQGKVHSFDLDGQNTERIFNITQDWQAGTRIESVLRYYVNSYHFTPPITPVSLDIIMFDPLQYITDGFPLRDDWFVGGSAKELISKLSENSTVILDTRHAELLELQIGDTLIVNKYSDNFGPILKHYELKVIGFVKYFPAWGNIEDKLYKPFALQNIAFATPEFQEISIDVNPIPPHHNYTTYWMIKTEQWADRTAILNAIIAYTNPSVQFVDPRESLTLDDQLSSQKYISEINAYREISGILAVITFLLVIILGLSLLADWGSYVIDHEQEQLIEYLGYSKKAIPLLHFLNQVILLIITIIIGVFLGTVLTEITLQIFMPETTLPVYYYFESLFYPIVYLSIILLLGSIILFTIHRYNFIQNSYHLSLIFQILIIGGILSLILTIRSLEVIIYYKKLIIIDTLFILTFIALVVFFTVLLWGKYLIKYPQKKIIIVILLRQFRNISKNVYLGLKELISLPNFHFYYFSFKKFVQNRQRLFMLLSSLVIALALIASVSINVDTTSHRIIRNYLDSPDRVADVAIYHATALEEPFTDYVNQLKSTKYPWIKNHSFLYRWYAVGMSSSATPEWVNNPEYRPKTSVSSIFSIPDNFKMLYEKQIIMEAGEFNTTGNQVVVTQKYIDFFLSENTTIGTTFSLFDWLSTTKGGLEFQEYRNVNWSTTVQIAGILSDKSPIFQTLSDVLEGFYHINILGEIFMGITEETFPSFWEELSFQPVGPCLHRTTNDGKCVSFDKLSLFRFDDAGLDPNNPTKFINEIGMFFEDIRTFIGYSNKDILKRFEGMSGTYPTNGELFREMSSLLLSLHEYNYWVTVVRGILLVLSIPILFLGWYLADFAFKHVYRSRRKEISEMKSRGASNGQIWKMLIFEDIILSIGATLGGLLLGIIAVFGLEFTQNEKFPSDFFISYWTVLIVGILSIILTLLGSIRPIRLLIKYPIEEMYQERDQVDIIEYNRDLELNNLKDPFLLTLIGSFILLGLSSLPENLVSTNFTVFFTIIGLGAFLIGFISVLALISRLIPSFLQKYFNIGKNSAQWFLVTRELKRYAKQSSAAFIVLALALSYGIISLSLVSSYTDYNDRISSFETGADIRLNVKSNFQLTLNLEFKEIENNLENDPDVHSITSYYHTRGYILLDQKNHIFPRSSQDINTYFAKCRYLACTEFPEIDILFIDQSTYFDVAYLEDYGNNFFVDDSLIDIKTRFNAAVTQYINDPINNKLPILIDEENAKKRSLKVNDPIYFTTGYLEVFEGKGQIMGLLKNAAPGLSTEGKGFILAPRVNMESIFLIENPTSNFLLRINHNKDGRTISNKYLEWPIESVTLPSDFFEIERNYLEFESLKTALTLNIIFSMFLASVGFILVLEIKISSKRSELGIIKAMGFGNAEVFLLVLIEAIIIIIVACVGGVLAGLLAGHALLPLFPPHNVNRLLVVPILTIIGLISLALTVSIFGSGIPARRTNNYQISELIK
ncbi:MAG: FtsX-like permease family protein [Candidatus Hodarchaeales archaeon]|jgi:ABC-type lipoprotein release transport system permease subunit